MSKNTLMKKSIFLYLLIGFLAGIVSGFFGAGGGMILVPFMTLIIKETEVKSRATTILCIFFMVLVSSFFYYKQESVDWYLAIKCSIGGNFTTAMKPQLTKAIAQKDYQRAYDLMNCGSRYSFILMLIFAVPIFITTPQLLELWLGEVPVFSVEFVRWTMIYILLDTLSRMMIHAILSYGQIKVYQLVVGGTKLLAVPLVWFFLKINVNPLWGIWVNIILELICLIERLYYSNKLLSFNFWIFCRDVILICSLLAAVAYSMSALFVPLNFMVFFSSSSRLCIAWAAILFLSG